MPATVHPQGTLASTRKHAAMTHAEAIAEKRIADATAQQVLAVLTPALSASTPAISQLPPFMRKRDFASRLGLRPETISRWIRSGKLKQTPDGRITAQEARRFGL